MCLEADVAQVAPAGLVAKLGGVHAGGKLGGFLHLGVAVAVRGAKGSVGRSWSFLAAQAHWK